MDTHAVHSRVEGEDEEHHEKTSVLKKMKAKARKFRDTITGHGHHGHEPEGHHTPDDHDLDEEDDEDVDDPDVHAAPIVRDSAVKKTDAPVQGDILKLPVVNFGDNRAGHDEREPVVPSERSNVNVSDPLRSNVPELHGTTDHGATHNSAATRRADAPVQGGTHFGETHHEYDPVVPKERSNINVGISDPVRDSVPGQNRTTTGHEDLLGGARTKPSGPTTGSGLKHEEPKGLVDVIGGGSHAPHNTITTDVDPGKTRVKLGKTDVLGEGTPVPQGTPVSSGTHRSDMDVDPRQTFVSGQGGHLGESRVDLDRPIGLEEDPHSSKANPQAYTPSNYETKVTDPTKPSGPTTGSVLKHEESKGLVDVIGEGSHAPHNTITTDVDTGKTFGSGQGEQLGQTRVKLGNTDVLGEGTPVPQTAPVSSGTHRSDMDVDPRQTFVSAQGGRESRVDLDRPIGLEEDPHSSKANSQAYTPSNYETKVTDPTKPSGPTTGSVLKHEEPKGLVDAIGEGSHAPHNTITTDVDPGKTFGSGQGEHLGQTRVKLGNTDVLGEGTPVPQTAPVSSGTHRSDMDVDPRQTFVSGQGGHLGESRVNVDRPIGLEEAHSPKANPQAYTPSNYETKVTDPTKSGGEEIGVTPMLHSFDKMNLDGDDRQHLKNDAKQNPSTGSHDQFSPDKPSNQGSSYAEKFSYATSAIADAAISAKNAVASKLGYGGNEPDHDDYSRGYITGAGKSGSSPRNKVLDPSTNQFRPAETPQVQGTIKADHDATTDQKPVLTGGSYTERISSAGSAIADKAISAKNVVASQLGYGATDQVHDREDVTRTNVHSGTSAADQHGKMITSNQAGQDKGVSVKDYFVEKLRPGEEDKALSEVMSETLHKPKSGVKQETGNSHSARPKGKVTESAEVRQRLGNTEGNENFVVDKIEETVGSMLGGAGKSDEERRQGLSSSAATGEEDQHQRVRVSGN